MKHFEKFGILAEQQHGFRKGRPCETQLPGLIDDMQKVLDIRGQVILIVTTFEKAFDVVPYDRLLCKLDHLGFRNKLHTWLKNFLKDRHQKVQSSGRDFFGPVTCEVTCSAGYSVIAYVNDLPNNVSSRIQLFTDDCILYREIKTLSDQVSPQADIDFMLGKRSGRWVTTLLSALS